VVRWVSLLVLLAGCDRLFALEHVSPQPDDAFEPDGVKSEGITGAALGATHTCAIRAGGVRCWGSGALGRLGYANTTTIGDNEVPRVAGDIDVGASVIAVSAGAEHTCALDINGKVRCWGSGSLGRLGYGNVTTIGDNERPSVTGVVNIGVDVLKLAAGDLHSCVVTFDQLARCWGAGSNGRLGYGNINAIGDNELPRAAGDVTVGRFVHDIVAGGDHTCVITDAKAVRCWGSGALGQLGYAAVNDIGDTEAPVVAGDVDVGGRVKQLAAGTSHTCALLEDNTIRCWGSGASGRLGYGNINIVGDDETPASLGSIDVGGGVVEIAAGGSHTCAVLADKTLRCWGNNQFGQLGHGNTESIGDNETPAAKPVVPVGEPVDHVWADREHTCVQVEAGGIRCWGRNADGRLGYARIDTIGDNEPASSVGDVAAF
jgi:alpha-tubulin suppressor-like RCC1 family protein